MVTLTLHTLPCSIISTIVLLFLSPSQLLVLWFIQRGKVNLAIGWKDGWDFSSQDSWPITLWQQGKYGVFSRQLENPLLSLAEDGTFQKPFSAGLLGSEGLVHLGEASLAFFSHFRSNLLGWKHWPKQANRVGVGNPSEWREITFPSSFR